VRGHGPPERGPKREDLPQQDREREHVALGVVRELLDDLGGKVRDRTCASTKVGSMSVIRSARQRAVGNEMGTYRCEGSDCTRILASPGGRAP
jgi:hypothetical protein